MLVTTSLLPTVGCRGTPYRETRSLQSFTTSECLSCHATHQPSDRPADVSARNDILRTHYDDVFVDSSGRLVYKDTTTAFADGNAHFVFQADDGSLVPLFPVDSDGKLIPSDPANARSAPLVDDATADASDLAAPNRIEGYVQSTPLSFAPSGFGYTALTLADGSVDSTACGTSCHDNHAEDPLPLKQWASSPMADQNSGAFTTSMAAVCQRCHNGIVYATYVDPSNTAYPGFTASSTTTSWVTCNACHNGLTYPTRDDPAMRFVAQTVQLTAGSPAAKPGNAVAPVSVPVDPGNASCMHCHQYRESGQSLQKKIDAWLKGAATACDGSDTALATDAAFGAWALVDPHVGGATDVMLSLRGFELPNHTYALGHAMHQGASCVGCHMVDKSDIDDDPLARGGHTMRAAGCDQCHHVDFQQADFANVGRLIDADGNGVAEHPKAELDGLVSAVQAALATRGVYYNPRVYPYVYDTPDTSLHTGARSPHVFKAWTTAIARAMFNLIYVMGDGGAYVHNFRYCGQLLRDTLEDLGQPLATGVRPAAADDRRSTVCP